MNPHVDVEFWLRVLVFQVLANAVMRRVHENEQLRGIERATVDREFREIVDERA